MVVLRLVWFLIPAAGQPAVSLRPAESDPQPEIETPVAAAHFVCPDVLTSPIRHRTHRLCGLKIPLTFVKVCEGRPGSLLSSFSAKVIETWYVPGHP